MNDDVYIVVFDSAGYIASLTIIEKQYASNTAKQLRAGHRKVHQMTRDEFLELQEKDAKKRKENIKMMEDCFK